MDTFFEQIVSVRKSAGTVLAILGIWLLAIILSVAAFMFGGTLAAIIICGIFYGAFKLSTRFNIEYEYIITNGIMDVDKIINKSSRKRMLSFNLAEVSRLEKYNPAILNNVDKKSVLFACNTDDSDAYLMVVTKEKGGNSYLVFAPNEKIKSATVKFIPKFLANSAFK